MCLHGVGGKREYLVVDSIKYNGKVAVEIKRRFGVMTLEISKQVKFYCIKCGNITTKAQMDKIAKLTSSGVRQEYCTTKQCIANNCNSRLFFTFK